jgi:hypothetical protein
MANPALRCMVNVAIKIARIPILYANLQAKYRGLPYVGANLSVLE